MRTTDFLVKFLKKDEDEIFDLFSTIKGAIINNIYPRWLYIEGQREDRVLMVAHADTVWTQPPKRIVYRNGVLYNADLHNIIKNNKLYLEGEGIGADDRSGIAMLWSLKNNGHSILITEGEEIGIGSFTTAFDPFIQQIVTEHCYAIEFDRANSSEVVFYNNEPKEFKDFVKAETGYYEAAGSFTDVKVICEKLIPSFNISIGYNHAHQPNEMQVVPAWEQTFFRVKQMLDKEQKRWKLF